MKTLGLPLEGRVAYSIHQFLSRVWNGSWRFQWKPAEMNCHAKTTGYWVVVCVSMLFASRKTGVSKVFSEWTGGDPDLFCWLYQTNGEKGQQIFFTGEQHWFHQSTPAEQHRWRRHARSAEKLSQASFTHAAYVTWQRALCMLISTKQSQSKLTIARHYGLS